MLRELNILDAQSIAFTGAGGKTTAVYTCVEEFLKEGIPALAVTTTKMRKPNRDFIPWNEETDLDKIVHMILKERKSPKPRLWTLGVDLQNGKISEAPEEVFGYMRKQGIRLCVEADGSAGKWIKVPREYEPAVPSWIDVQIGILNGRAIGRTFLEAAHRPEECAAWFLKDPDEKITAEDLAKLYLHPEGILKGQTKRKRAVLSGMRSGEGITFMRKFPKMKEKMRKSGLPFYIWEYAYAE